MNAGQQFLFFTCQDARESNRIYRIFRMGFFYRVNLVNPVEVNLVNPV